MTILLKTNLSNQSFWNGSLNELSSNYCIFPQRQIHHSCSCSARIISPADYISDLYVFHIGSLQVEMWVVGCSLFIFHICPSILPRYNWYTAFCKFKVYNVMIRYINTDYYNKIINILFMPHSYHFVMSHGYHFVTIRTLTINS